MALEFKNKERQALLDELLLVCKSLAKHGLPEDIQVLVKGSSRLGLSCRTSKEENALYLDLITLDNQALQPFTIQVYTKNEEPWVYLYYFDKSKISRRVDVPLAGARISLMNLILGIPNQSRVVAFRNALALNLKSYIYWVD